MLPNILNLPGYKVVGIEENNHDYHVKAEVSNPPETCPACQSTHMNGHGRVGVVVRDLPIHGKRVGIYVEARRWRCQSCGKTGIERLPHTDGKREMTERLTRWIGQQSLRRTFASISDDIGVDEKTVRNIFRDYINELETQFRFETPKWMGIDEIHLIKPRCVISNIRNNTIIDLLHNRDKKTVINYLYKLQGKNEVQHVAMDMWQPYRDAVQAVLPHAQIVIDKFHVVRMANAALEKVRKGLRSELTLKQKRGLMHDRFILLKRERGLDDQERFLLDGWTLNYPALGEAYRLKEGFYAIYEQSGDAQQAKQRYGAWKAGIPPDVAEAFKDLTRAFDNWMPYILNYFDHPITNAYTERLNNLIRVMNRLGRGYSFEALRAKILFTEGAHKHTLSRPKFEWNTDLIRHQGRAAGDINAYGFPDMLEKSIPTSLIRSKPADPQNQTNAPKNYGSDINTLIELLESGGL